MVAAAQQEAYRERQRQRLELMWPPLDPHQPRGRLKRRRVQRRWGVRPQRQPAEGPPAEGQPAGAGAQHEGEAPQQEQQEQGLPGRKRKRPAELDGQEGPRQEGPQEEPQQGEQQEEQHGEMQQQQQQHGEMQQQQQQQTDQQQQQQQQTDQQQQQQQQTDQQQEAQQQQSEQQAEQRLEQVQAPEGGAGGAGAAGAAAAAAGQVPLPIVTGVPTGLIQQLALLPAGRPDCGSCASCTAEGDPGKGCRVVAALRRWDALLPGLSPEDLEQLKQAKQRCGRCRTCLLDAHGGAGRKRRGGGAVCMALSRVRLGRLPQKLQQLQQERDQWAAEQERRQRQLTGVADGDGDGPDGPDAGAASPSPSDSEGSNRSRAWLRDQRRKGQQWRMPLPAADGSLPLPVVPGVPWERTRHLAEAWGEGQPERCGVCAACKHHQPEQEGGGDAGSEGGASPPPGQQQQQRCITAAALAAWDRQLGPVTSAAVQAVAALSPRELKQARCGCCRLCRNPGRKPVCATVRKLEAGTLPPRLRQAADAALAEKQQQQQQQPVPPTLPSGLHKGSGRTARKSGDGGKSTASDSSTVTLPGTKKGGGARDTGTGQGARSPGGPPQQPTSAAGTASRGRSSGDGSMRHRDGSRGYAAGSSMFETSTDSSTGTSSAAEAEGSDSGAGGIYALSGGSSGGEDDREVARWLPWMHFYVPAHRREGEAEAVRAWLEGRPIQPDAELAAARQLVRRRRDRELRRQLQRRHGQRRQGGALLSEPWDLKGVNDRRRVMEAEARCLAAELRVPLESVTEWRCIAQVPAGQGRKAPRPAEEAAGSQEDSADAAVVCRRAHTIHKPGWHLWQCTGCGAPRWDGPGWQLEQRLCAALQAGAALCSSLVPLHGSGRPASVAAAAASAALARFRWEAGEAGAEAEGTALPDAAGPGGSGIGDGEAAAADVEGQEEGLGPEGPPRVAPHAAHAVSTLPCFDAELEFQVLAALAGDMLAHSWAAAEGGAAAALELQLEQQQLSAEHLRWCRDLRRSDLGRAATRLETAVMRLVEEQEGLAAAAQQQRRQPAPPLAQQPQELHPALAQWQPPSVAVPAAAVSPAGAAGSPVQQQGPAEQRDRPAQEAADAAPPAVHAEEAQQAQQEAAQPLSYADYLEQAMGLLAGGDGDEGGSGSGSEGEESQRILQLCDAFFFLPTLGASASSAPHSVDRGRAALARLRQLLQPEPGAVGEAPQGQQPLQQQAQEQALPQEQPGQVQRAAAEGDEVGEQELQDSAAPMQLDSPTQQQQQQEGPSPAQGVATVSGLVQPAKGGSQQQQSRERRQQQLGGHQHQHQQQPSPLLPMSQAADNMPGTAAAAALEAAPPPDGAVALELLPFAASQQAEVGDAATGTVGAASPHLPGGGFLIGTEASQPDPMQQDALFTEQQLQRELLELRQRQQERERQRREERTRRQQEEQRQQEERQRQRQQQEQAAAAAAQQEERGGAQQAAGREEEQAEDPAREGRLAGASEATYHATWRLMGEVLRSVLEQGGAPQKQQQNQPRMRSPRRRAKLRLPPPPASLHTAAAEGFLQAEQPAVDVPQVLAPALPQHSSAAPEAADASGRASRLSQPPTAWVAWQRGDAEVAARPPAPLARETRTALLRALPRFVPLTTCQPGHGPPPSATLQALLPADALPASTPVGGPSSGAGEGVPAEAEAGAKPKPKPRVQWHASVGEEGDEEAQAAERRRLVGAHPQLVLLLEHAELQRCGACKACTGEAPPVPKGKPRGRKGSRNCLQRQRFITDFGRLRRQQEQQAAGSEPPARRRRTDPLQVPLSGGVQEADALRVAAAYKLLYPGWQPSFLTEARLAAVEASLLAAVADLQRRQRAASDGGSDSDATEDEEEARQAQQLGAAGAGGGFFKGKQRERMQRILAQIRGEAEGPPEAGQAEQQQLEQQEEEEEEAGASQLPLTQLAPTLPASPLEEALAAYAAAAPNGPTPRRQRQRQQPPAWAPGRAGSAFGRLLPTGTAAATAEQPGQPAGQPASQQQQERPQQVSQEQLLESQLAQLPTDVQLAFRAGLSAGLPPAAVAAAIRRYQDITSLPAAARPRAKGRRGKAQPAAGGSGGTRSGAARKRRRRSSSSGSDEVGKGAGNGSDSADEYRPSSSDEGSSG